MNFTFNFTKGTFVFLFFCISCQFGFTQTKDATFYGDLLKEYEIPGLAIAIIKDGEVNSLSHHGVKSNDTQKAVEHNTIFGAASLSKPVFAYAVMKLVKQGKIDLDKPVYLYLKNRELEYDKRYKTITTRMLLSHSGGLPNWRKDDLRLVHDPGSNFQYSGEGYVYLSKVIEHILQKPINQVMRELVFQPLGMNNSSFIWEDRFQVNFASPHDYTGTPKPNWRPEDPVIASSLQTTAADYAKFMIAVLKGEDLSKSAQSDIGKPQIKIDDSLAWGLGWGIRKAEKNEYLWQWGDNGTYKAFAMMYPDREEGMVFFVNSYKGLRMLPKIINHVFEDMIPQFSMLERSMQTRADEKLMLGIIKNGYERAIRPFLLSSTTNIDPNLISENQASYVAMQLKWRKRYEDERKLLKLIAESFPKSFMAQKSYAQYCIKHAYQEEGIQYYKKAQAILPKNKQITNTLRLLTAEELTGNVTFVYSDYLWASSVSVAGSFNEWSSSSMPMLKKNGVWTTTIQLEPGTYSYYFVVDGYPMLDPNCEEVKKEDWLIFSVLKVE
ncbi:MAG: serine hydrolase [Bacteroidota bacterium]